MGLRVRKALGAKNMLLQSDSKLVIGKIKEEYEANEERMQKYLKLTKRLTQEFDKVEFVQIPRSQNMIANEIAKIASLEEGSISMGLEMEAQKRPSIEEISTFAIQNTQLDDPNHIIPPRWSSSTRRQKGQEGQKESSQIHDTE